MAASALNLQAYGVTELEAREAARAEGGVAQVYLAVRILKIAYPYIRMAVGAAAATWGAKQADN